MSNDIVEDALKDCSDLCEKLSDQLASMRTQNLKLHKEYLDYQRTHEFYNQDDLMGRLKSIVFYYTVSAPTVSRWADELYMQIQEDPSRVTLVDIYAVKNLFAAYGSYVDAHTAANLIYKHMHSQGKDVTGHLGF
jgi:hypothetical protein